MDLGLSEEQQLLQQNARDFLQKECPESLVRAMEEDEKGYSPELWKKMADQGWQGLLISEEHGGAEFNFMDLMVLIEEFGRALVPGPFVPTVVLGAIPIMEAGSDEQKQKYLPLIASGEAIFTMAYTEPSGRFDLDAIQMEAKADGDGYVLNGTKLFVPDAHVSDYMIVVARVNGGLTMFVVDSKSEGISTTVLKTIADDKQCEVVFEKVKAGKDALLGAAGGAEDALKEIIRKATVAECAYLVGLAQMDFEISVDYAKERVQFGRPIGSFQAIQHKAADMVTDVDGARFITYKAAWSVAEKEPDADMMVHMAKAWTSEATRRVVAHGQQIHGGIGFTKEYKIQLFFRRQKRAELFWGDADFHREKVADLLAI